MKNAVIGTGYAGLVTGTCLSDYGNGVYCAYQYNTHTLAQMEIAYYQTDLVRRGRI